MPTTLPTASGRHNVPVLALCQALFMSVQTIGIATTPLAAHAMLGEDKSLATFPIFLVHLGVMLTTVPASLLMAQIGRRAGFSVGAMMGIGSGVVSVIAVVPALALLFLVLRPTVVAQGAPESR
jgi:hypothetical protein